MEREESPVLLLLLSFVDLYGVDSFQKCHVVTKFGRGKGEGKSKCKVKNAKRRFPVPGLISVCLLSNLIILLSL